MIYAGLDVGSRTIKLVTFDTVIRDSLIAETGVRPLQRCREILAGRDYGRLVVTGYGRHLVAPVLHGEIVSEIKAFAVGARYLFPDCRTVIDVGGQDSKVIILTDTGEVLRFEMNDRCAAGTGKFLEVMAHSLEASLRQLSDMAVKSERAASINSLCTVFAESEVVSLVARGESTPAIALGLHEAIATRLSAMANRCGIREKVVFAGGGSLNVCLASLLKRKLNTNIIVPDSPQIVGA